MAAGAHHGHQRIEVVQYDVRWEQAQTAFARRNWAGKARRADPAYLRWEYRGPSTGAVSGLLLAVDGEQVVGQLGRIPGQARVAGELVPIGWIGNLMVEPEYRRQGVSSALLQGVLELPGCTLGTDPSPAAAKTLAAFGFGQATSSDLFVLPLRAGPVVSVRYPALRGGARVVDLIGRPIVGHVTRKLRRAQDDDRAQVCSWTDVVGLVSRAETSITGPHAVHDEEFLRWRCGGFGSWVRTCDAVRTPAGSFALVERAGQRLLVLHWHAVDPDEAAALLGRVVYLAESYGMDYIQAMAAEPDQVGVMTGLGFQRRRTPTDLWCHPMDGYGADRFQVQGYDSDQNL